MGIQNTANGPEVYHRLTKTIEQRDDKQRWTLQLFLCSLTVCLASFQFGFNIGSLNTLTPFVQEFYFNNFFKDIYVVNKEKFDDGERRFNAGLQKWNDGQTMLRLGKEWIKGNETELKKAEKIREEYLEIAFSTDPERIREVNEYIENRTKMVKEKYNMTLEQFLPYAKKQLKEKKVQLEEGRIKLENGSIQLNHSNHTLAGFRVKLSDGKRKLDFVNKVLIWGFTNALFVIGGMIGALTSKVVMDKMGRKKGILFHYTFSIAGSILVIVAPYVNQNIVAPILVKLGRLLFGVQGGMSCSLIPTYLSEISPQSLRGQTGVMHQLFLTFGILFAQFLGFSQILGTPALWHVCLGIPVIPSVLGFVLLLFLFYETPKALLLEKKDEDAALNALRMLRNSENVSAELNEIYLEGSEMNAAKPFTICDVIRLPEFRLPLLCGIVLQLAQQLSGINIVFFYSISIFKSSGVDQTNLQYAIFLTGLVNFVSTVVCVPMIERFGRKPLLTIPMVIMILDLVALTVLTYLPKSDLISTLSIVSVMVFIVSYAVGLGPVPFIFVAEAFKQNSRSSAMSICVFINWFSAFLLVLLFPVLIHFLKNFIFFVFMVPLLLSLVFIVFKLPETKGRNVDQIQASFMREQSEFLELGKKIEAQA